MSRLQIRAELRSLRVRNCPKRLSRACALLVSKKWGRVNARPPSPFKAWFPATLAVCVDESPLSKISGLIPARCAQTQEKRTAAFWSFMLREIKRAVLRDCEVHIWLGRLVGAGGRRPHARSIESALSSSLKVPLLGEVSTIGR